MEVTIGTCFFTEWNMDINPGQMCTFEGQKYNER